MMKIARFAGSHHGKVVAHADTHVHSENCSHGEVHEDHEGHGHSHHNFPEGSWHRHSDDEDPDYYYNRYGPFHSFSVAYYNMPDHPGETPENDMYRHTVQGYIRLVDPDDNRRNIYRGLTEAMLAGSLFLLGLSFITKRHQFDDDFAEKKIGDALITAQEIEIFIKQAKASLVNK